MRTVWDEKNKRRELIVEKEGSGGRGGRRWGGLKGKKFKRKRQKVLND